MAKKGKGNRIQVIMECTEHKDSGVPGVLEQKGRLKINTLNLPFALAF